MSALNLRTTFAIAAFFHLTEAMAQDAPADALDASWISVCTGAQPNSTFFDRCQEIINAGPGSAGRRSAAAVGNNLGVVGAQGRRATRDEERADAARVSKDFGAWSILANARLGNRDRDASDFENGFSEDVRAFDLGLDYRINDQWVIGAVATFENADADFDGQAGELDADSQALTTLVSGTFGNGWWAQGYLGYRALEYDATRNISYQLVVNADTPQEAEFNVADLATGSTDGDQLIAGIGFGKTLAQGAWSLTPQLALDVVDTDIDAYAELSGNGLAQRFSSQSVRSLSVSGGMQVARSISMNFGVLQPFGRLTWQHEFDNDARELTSSFVSDTAGTTISYATQSPDRNFGELAIGVTMVLADGKSAYIGYRHLLSHTFLDDGQLQIGGRFEF
ncbi:MAG: autotransporter outer membrane beta-barrel domain-containing protein [Lysobacterales bacterium]